MGNSVVPTLIDLRFSGYGQPPLVFRLTPLFISPGFPQGENQGENQGGKLGFPPGENPGDY